MNERDNLAEQKHEVYESFDEYLEGIQALIAPSKSKELIELNKVIQLCRMNERDNLAEPTVNNSQQIYISSVFIQAEVQSHKTTQESVVNESYGNLTIENKLERNDKNRESSGNQQKKTLHQLRSEITTFVSSHSEPEVIPIAIEKLPGLSELKTDPKSKNKRQKIEDSSFDLETKKVIQPEKKKTKRDSKQKSDLKTFFTNGKITDCLKRQSALFKKYQGALRQSYTCPECYSVFRTEAVFKIHMLNHEYICIDCLQRPGHRSALSQSYTCPECDSIPNRNCFHDTYDKALHDN